MNAKDIYTIWKDKYNSKYGLPYIGVKIPAEMYLLKQLLANYGENVVKYAIIQFINQTPKEKTVILNFASPKYFENRFDNLLKLKKILPYCELMDEEVNNLISEYKLYAVDADTVSDTEKIRKKEILDILENKYAKRIGR